MYVFVPGPAFARVWPALEALQRAGAAMVRTMSAAQESGRLTPLPPGSAPEEIRAHYAGMLTDEVADAAAVVRALALELHDEAGPLSDAPRAMVVGYPSDAAGVLPEEARDEVARFAPSLGFPGGPPYYVLMVHPAGSAHRS